MNHVLQQALDELLAEAAILHEEITFLEALVARREAGPVQVDHILDIPPSLRRTSTSRKAPEPAVRAAAEKGHSRLATDPAKIAKAKALYEQENPIHSVADVAAQAGISHPTVLRYARLQQWIRPALRIAQTGKGAATPTRRVTLEVTPKHKQSTLIGTESAAKKPKAGPLDGMKRRCPVCYQQTFTDPCQHCTR